VSKIGISTAFLGNLRAGTWQYTRHLLAGVAGRDGFTMLDREARELPEVDLQLRSYPGGGKSFAKLLWPNFILPQRAAADGLDLVHCTTPYGTFMPCRYRNVITICDVTPLLFPGTHGRMNVWHHRFALPSILRNADHVITISEASKRDIVKLYGVKESKVTVTLLAADQRFGNPLGTQTSVPAERPYILNVGTLEPRKNLPCLLQSYAAAKRKGLQHKLVVTGASGWGGTPLARLVDDLNLHADVTFTGFIPDEELPGLYAGAEMFVYPSLYEGFGLPVLEAMASGTPVITSNVSSLPEVAGTAALLVDPHSQEELSAAMLRLAGDGDLRNAMRASGRLQAKRFSWEQSVAETIRVYELVLGAG
jgi:glycosyltransferase involved in cell wall biosynthesis